MMSGAAVLADDAAVVQRILDHIDRRTTDLGARGWREPVANYRSPERFAAERALLRRTPVMFAPSAALAEAGAWIAREVAGTPLLVVRGADGRVRAFRNACRHRGMLLAEGTGCSRAFACRYHGWTYALDGELRHVPGEHGFPGLDRSARGLVAVHAEERGGVIFVAQEGDAAALGALPSMIPPGYRVIGRNAQEVPANWKILVEGFLEGYHIRSTHPKTFYPLQYDNLNVVEHFGRNSRVVFPYQSVERLRGAPAAQRTAEGRLTYVYHLFPNGIVATFPNRIVCVVLEPVAPDRTSFVTMLLSDRDPSDAPAQAALRSGLDLVDAGATEDREVACAIQRGLASGANEFFEFGLFEGAIVHFHAALREALAGGS